MISTCGISDKKPVRRTKAPVNIMGFSVVSREIVRIVLMTAALHDLDVKLGSISNDYIQASVKEWVRTILSPKFCIDC